MEQLHHGALAEDLKVSEEYGLPGFKVGGEDTNRWAWRQWSGGGTGAG